MHLFAIGILTNYQHANYDSTVIGDYRLAFNSTVRHMTYRIPTGARLGFTIHVRQSIIMKKLNSATSILDRLQ